MTWYILGMQMEETVPPPYAHILNKQSLKADKRWSSSMRFWEGPNNSLP